MLWGVELLGRLEHVARLYGLRLQWRWLRLARRLVGQALEDCLELGVIDLVLRSERGTRPGHGTASTAAISPARVRVLISRVSGR
jgi:hypothetical protein